VIVLTPGSDDLRRLAEALELYRRWLDQRGDTWPGLDHLARAVTTGQRADHTGHHDGPATTSSDTDNAWQHALLTSSEAAERLRISARSLRRLAASGEIPTVRVGARGVRFRAADVHEYIRQRAT
jgi:excisionase family DNA binding protein